MTQPTTIRVTREGAMGRLTLHRPEVRNAFDEVLIAEMTEALGALEDDAAVRVVVLDAAGSAFCAGADLAWMRKMKDYSFQENLADAMGLAELLHRLYSLGKPTVARVQGPVIGGGNGLVAACDIAVASRDAFFSLSEVKIGLLPSCIGPYVVKKVGEGNARRLFLTGERFDADRALAVGIVNEVVDAGNLDAAVARWVARLLAGGPHAQRACKELLENLAQMPLEEAKSYTAELIARMRIGEEAQEGMNAFFEKRPPRWGRPRSAPDE